MTFWHKFELEFNDYIYVEISTDGGFNWSAIYSHHRDTDVTWHQEQIDLSSYKTSDVKIRFRLVSDGDTSVWDGWYVDDVEIKEL